MWGRWSTEASSVCCRHVTHLSSPWERSVSPLFATLWSQGRNLALFQEEWFSITVPQILCSFRQFLLDFLRYPRDCFSRNPLVLIEHDQKHLAVVYFIKNFIVRGLSLTTTFSHHTAYHFIYQFCCLFLPLMWETRYIGKTRNVKILQYHSQWDFHFFVDYLMQS